MYPWTGWSKGMSFFNPHWLQQLGKAYLNPCGPFGVAKSAKLIGQTP